MLPIPSLQRVTRVIIFTGTLWAIVIWSWAIYLSSSLLVLKSSSFLTVNGPSPYLKTAKGVSYSRDIHTSIGSRQNLRLSSATENMSSFGNINFVQNLSALPVRYTRQADFPPLSRSPIPSIATPLSPLIYPLHAKAGTHHAYLYIGTPPQRQTVIVDTGSRLTAFPCESYCPGCGIHASATFEPNKSTSFEIIPCERCRLSGGDFGLHEYFNGDGVGGNSGDGDAAYVVYSNLRGGKNENDMEYDEIFRRQKVAPEACRDNQCKLVQKYTEGSSWTAFEVTDRVWLGLDGESESVREHAQYSSPFAFGCQTAEEGLFRSQYADGIMGLSMYTYTLVGEWYKHGSINHHSFSLCFNQTGGHMSLGGTGLTYENDSERSIHYSSTDRDGYYRQRHQQFRGRHLAPMQFTPFARRNVWYYTVTVLSVSVGSHFLPKDVIKFFNDFKGTIVDSGTTDTFLPHPVSTAFNLAWEQVTGRRYNNRIQSYTHAQFTRLPAITFGLEGGVKWRVLPADYMEPTGVTPLTGSEANANMTTSKQQIVDAAGPWKGDREFLSRIYVDEPHGAVLGSNVMMNHDVYFDIANRRLGIARAICAY